VGAHIQATLEDIFNEAQRALEGVLQKQTLADVVQDLGVRYSTSLQKNSA
jgi:DNA-binding IscR family transcriptional regulator